MTSAIALSASHGFGVNAPREHVFDVFGESDLGLCDFAKRNDAALIVGLDKRLSVTVELKGSFYSEVYERESIGNLFEAVFNSNACHGSLPSSDE
jgi:hypothetical protein